MHSAKNIMIFLIFVSFLSHAQNNFNEKWKTVFENSGYLSTADYEKSMSYFKMFAENYPEVKMSSFGKSPQGRDLNFLIISKDKLFTPESVKKAGKPVVFIVNGIHSGEIEGKDACMLLLREILVTKEKKELIEDAVLIIVPIFSVDGHERKSKYSRINQNGPEEMGWRTTAQNLNLNRDWIKADAPEMQAMLKLFSKWLPDLFIDTHTTDGADYQYTVTYGLDKFQNLYSGLAGMVKKDLIPHLEKRVEEQGFLISPYAGFKAGQPDSGLVDWPSTPRFSNGYATVRNRIGLLVETHMMKPYKERVFGTKAILVAALEYVKHNKTALLRMNNEADSETVRRFAKEKNYFPLIFKVNNNASTYKYKGIEAVKEMSSISGATKIVYTGKTYEKTIPYFNDVSIMDSVTAPFAYIIPREWSIIVDRLALHGVKIDTVDKEITLEVQRYIFKNVKFNSAPYEGRQPVTCQYDTYTEKVNVKKGSFIVRTDQRTFKIILMAMEPKSGDSFLRWGFMNQIFEQKEYFEDYVMERVALEMLAADKQLEEEFNKRLAEDEKFRNDPDARLNFFYERSPYSDKAMNVYPVMRVIKN